VPRRWEEIAPLEAEAYDGEESELNHVSAADAQLDAELADLANALDDGEAGILEAKGGMVSAPGGTIYGY
jgi:hypothetical protein